MERKERKLVIQSTIEKFRGFSGFSGFSGFRKILLSLKINDLRITL